MLYLLCLVESEKYSKMREQKKLLESLQEECDVGLLAGNDE